ncbi:acyl-CoA N-acyltransferase [Ascodesmis nigricans]|uniref:Acyl-CoA N-acyltransferase n=1 Tax=Ascodesmis nigricans TaxID=341454 RepID=A0A4S2MSS7_9PEZI|nr:acyl-CoA N-acyltransferase [Ascodesmis nigricans]
MRFNASTALVSPYVVLVPYSAHHVPTYHAWMENEEIREATASERLTLEEEYAMQISWREDADKLTFIACRREGSDKVEEPIDAGVADTPERMIGDVNLFLSELEDDEDEENTSTGQSPRPPLKLVGEVELMIAAPEYQGKGYGRAVLRLFLSWVYQHRAAVVSEKLAAEHMTGGLDRFRVKIHNTNHRSLGLFESIGFKRVKEEPNYFGEVEMEMSVEDAIDAKEGVKEASFRLPEL